MARICLHEGNYLSAAGSIFIITMAAYTGACQQGFAAS